jgi:hypothetical protein
MSPLQELSIPKVPGVTIALDAQGKLTLKGNIATRDPAGEIAPFLRRIHDVAVTEKQRVFTVDVTGLEFVNSSAIRLFIDWVTWIRSEKAENQYKFVIVMDPQVTWQKTSLVVLKSLAPQVVELKPV